MQRGPQTGFNGTRAVLRREEGYCGGLHNYLHYFRGFLIVIIVYYFGGGSLL